MSPGPNRGPGNSGQSPGRGTPESGPEGLDDLTTNFSLAGELGLEGEDLSPLPRRPQSHDPKQRLMETHLGIVLRQARVLDGRGLGLDDLIGEGSLGLAEAIASFSSSGRADFEAHAEEVVARFLEAALAREEAASEDQHRLVRAAEDYERVELKLATELERRPSDAEIAVRLEWTPARAATVGEMVREARARHDQEPVQFVDPESLDLQPEEEVWPGRDE